MNIIIIANIFSFIGSCLMIAVSLIKTQKRIVLTQTLQTAFMALANLLLGGISGVVVNAVTILRNIICLRWELTTLLKLFFIALQIGITLFFGVNTPIMWLPVLASCLITWYLDTENIILLKTVLAGSAAMWLIYDISLLNISASVFDAVFIITSIVSMITIIRGKKDKDKE